jgi:crotonobetainyl-CoA:carnitine CoA-transferase CaiB-like acyl-CoA transferase
MRRVTQGSCADRLSPLAGLKVLELGDGVAGAYAADVLAALGATVRTVPAADSVLRALSPQSAGASVLSAVLDSRKRVDTVTTSDHLRREIANSDLIVCDRVHRAAVALPESAADYLGFVTEHNRGAWVTVSAFGLDPSKADRYGSDLTVAASSGVLSAVTDPGTGRPVKLPGTQALLSAGAATALAALHALSELAVTGRPQHAWVSAQAAALMTGPVIQCAAPMLNSEEAGGSGRFGAPSGLYECRDGAICIMAMEQHQWAGIVRTLGDPEWARDFDRVEDRLDRADECNALLAQAVRSWSRIDLEEKLQSQGVPAGALRSPRDLLSSPQFVSRGAFRNVEIDGRSAEVVNGPFRLTAGDGAGRVRAVGTIQGLRVLEASHILAAPLAGALLGACGADVVKVEDPRRPDSYRTRGPYVDGHVDENYSAYFALMNHSKQSLDVDLSQPEAVASLLGAADVLIENYGLSRSGKYKLGSQEVSSRYPDLLAVSSSGYGHTGPWASYRAYAYNLHVSSGLTDLTRTGSGRIAQLEMASADLMTGYALATIVAAWAVGSGRRPGAWADVAMAELLASRLSEFVAAAALGIGTGPETRGTRQAPYAPNGVYPAADGRMVAVSVLTDQEWEAVKACLGNPATLDNAEWGTAAGRAADQDKLDIALEAEVSRFPAGELVERLTDRQVPASLVSSVPDLVDAGGGSLDAAYRPEVDHPLWGKRRLLGLPWTFADGRPVQIQPPPSLGSARTAVGSWARDLGHPAERNRSHIGS